MYFDITKKDSLPFLSRDLILALKRYVLIVLWMSIAFLTVFLIFTYNPNSPSWTSSVGGQVPVTGINILGSAYLSDALVQSLGIASFLIPFICLGWVLHLYYRYKLPHFLNKLFFAFLSCILCAITFSLLPIPLPHTVIEWLALYHPGGWIGFLLSQPLTPPRLTIVNPKILGYITLGGTLWTLHKTISLRVFLTHVMRILLGQQAYDLSTQYFHRTLQHYSKYSSKIQHFVINKRQVLFSFIQQKIPSLFPSVSFPLSIYNPNTPLHNTSLVLLPPVTLLQDLSAQTQENVLSLTQQETEKQKLIHAFDKYGVQGEIQNISTGPLVNLYEMKLNKDVSLRRASLLHLEIAAEMSVGSVQIRVVESARNTLYISIPKSQGNPIDFPTLLQKSHFQQSDHKIPLLLGVDVKGIPKIFDLIYDAHLLLCGVRGCGKSTTLHTILLSLLYRFTPDGCRLILIDSKAKELSLYEGIPHLFCEVTHSSHQAIDTLSLVLKELETRLQNLMDAEFSTLEEWNEYATQHEHDRRIPYRMTLVGYDSQTDKPVYKKELLNIQKLPYLIVILDDLTDIVTENETFLLSTLQKLTKKGKKAGIHVIVTKRYEEYLEDRGDRILNALQNHFSSYISFRMPSKKASRTLLGITDAEQLLDQGDFFFKSDTLPYRLHGAFTSSEMVKRVVDFVKTQDYNTFS